MANRFFTILIVPEKSSKIRRFVIPGWILKGAGVGTLFLVALGFMMLLDYWYVMDQIDETKEFKIQNRRLRQQVQIYKNKMDTIEASMDRIKTFSTRLRVITNIEDRDALAKRLDQPLPDASRNVGQAATSEDEFFKPSNLEFSAKEKNPEWIQLQKDQNELESKLLALNRDVTHTETGLQDLYELLVDQKSFLAALPTRKPTVGYFTSGFGIRRDPYGRGEKMHEGLDMANRHGTPIRATAYGTVKFSGRKPGYGKTVIIDHGYGLETWYGHSRTLKVKKDQKVRRGQTVATMGSSGRSTGPHVHYEVRVHGIPVDPLSYILED